MTAPSTPWPFDNTYARLPEGFHARQPMIPVREPGLIRVNRGLAGELGIEPSELESPEGVAVLAGNRVPEGAEPIAMAYAGHQFGGFSPQLGDGRAVLLGEVVDRNGVRRDIQLKGSGPTPFSRGGDGRAWLGPVLREYLLSEAMHALGVPTTRALAAVSTGEDVYREQVLPGAVLTRVAGSHIRVGTFQFFAARQDTEALRTLFDYTVARHDPGVGGPLQWLAAVIERQASLVAQWMAVGFIHGVMNTDNVTVSGETIDYGPCAFMDTYHPMKVFSSIDRGGRYAFSRQPQIMVWNLAQLASALLPLIDSDEDKAIAAATEVIEQAPDAMHRAWLEAFRRKLGLVEVEAGEAAARGDTELINDLLSVMQAGEADFTNLFRALPDMDAARACLGNSREEVLAALDQWVASWGQRLQRQGESPEDAAVRMRKANPAIIPRNHRVEEAIQAGLTGDYGVFERLLEACRDPFSDRAANDPLTRPPAPHEVVTATFCGT